jgi:hypothetical protein
MATKDVETDVVDDEAAAHLARYAEHSSRIQTLIGGYGAGLASLLVYQFRTAVTDTKDSWKVQTGQVASKKLDEILSGMHADLRAALELVAMALAIQVDVYRNVPKVAVSCG